MRRCSSGKSEATDALEQGVATDRKTEAFSHPRTSFTTESKGQDDQCLVQPHSLAPVMSYDLWQSFAENFLRTEFIATPKLARVEMKADGYSMPGQICDLPRVVTMETGRCLLTLWAARS